MIRRHTIIAILLASTLLLSGCSAITSGETEYVAEEASVSQATVSETGFTLERSEWQNRSRDVDVAGQERTINASTYVEAYRGSGDRGAFAVLSTPAIAVAGQSMNPIADMTEAEIVQRLERGLEAEGDLEDLEEVETYTVSAAGEERTVTVFSATATRGDERVDVVIHVTKFEDGDDVLVGAGAHAAGDDEVRGDVEAMLAGIEH